MTEAQVLHHLVIPPRIPLQQFERFRRGAIHSPRAFGLHHLVILPYRVMFFVTGETGLYTIQCMWPNQHSTTASVECNCPDHYPGLCKHICWLVFKVLKHGCLDIFRTHTVPKEELEFLWGHEEGATALVQTWGRRAPPVRSSPLAVPASWPPSDVDCAICFDGMVEQATARQCQKCSNCFDEACINRWFSQKRSCPLCRHIFQWIKS